MTNNMNDKRKIIAILRGIAPSEIIEVCTALIDAGIKFIEVPLNSPQALESIALAAKKFGSDNMIGAGTVLSVEDAEAVAKAGGTFIVSPDCNEAVIAKTIELGMASYPGVLTPTEAFKAIKAGASGLKFFPAELVGPKGIAAMKAVLPPDMPVFAVGGAGPDNFAEYFAAGCAGFGLGSYIYKPGYSATEISKRAAAAVAAYDKEAS